MHEGAQREVVYKQILDSAFFVHSELGPGLLESAYEQCLYYELSRRGLKVEKQIAQILTYLKISGYRLGLLINFNHRHLKDGIRRVVK
jgi:FMN phosphatase YigB (HAD superfamily)